MGIGGRPKDTWGTARGWQVWGDEGANMVWEKRAGTDQGNIVP